jgi:catalase
MEHSLNPIPVFFKRDYMIFSVFLQVQTKFSRKPRLAKTNDFKFSELPVMSNHLVEQT